MYFFHLLCFIMQILARFFYFFLFFPLCAHLGQLYHLKFYPCLYTNNLQPGLTVLTQLMVAFTPFKWFIYSCCLCTGVNFTHKKSWPVPCIAYVPLERQARLWSFCTCNFNDFADIFKFRIHFYKLLIQEQAIRLTTFKRVE